MRRTASRISTRARDPYVRIERDAPTRVVDLRLLIKRRSTNKVLGDIGGRWDRAEHCFLSEPALRGRIIWINEAQVEAAKAILTWIEARKAGAKRVVEIVLDGDRGSGKTHVGALSVFLIAVAFPDARCWLVNPANTRRSEVDRIIKDNLPSSWLAWSERYLTYTLPNGSTVEYIGADDENALKQGGYEVALLNEAQLVSSDAYANVAAGIRNVSGRPKGLLLLAHNYASKVRGEWTNDHLDKIEANQINAVHYKMESRLNTSIDSDVRDDVDGLIRSVRPDIADRDVLGIRKRLGDYAAAAFKPFPLNQGGHVGLPPSSVIGLDGVVRAGWTDITREITAKSTDTSNGFARVIGADFQKRPGCVAVVFKIYRSETGKVIYFAEHVIVAGDNEDDLSDRIDSYLSGIGLTARDALVVADSSGRYQNAGHTRLTKPSHDIMREWQFTVVAPRRVNVSGKFGNKNPDVEDSLAQFYDICKDDRLVVHPAAEFGIESLRRCKVKKRGGTIKLDDADPGYSHPVDCFRYVTWYFEPKRGPVPAPYDKETADEIRKIRILTSP